MCAYKKYMVLLLGLFFSGLNCFGQLYNKEVQATLDVSYNDEFVTLKGAVLNKTILDRSLRYSMASFVTQEDGQVTTDKQEQRIALGPTEKKILDSLTFPRRDLKRKIFLLLIYNLNDEIIGKDRVVFNDDNPNEPDLYTFLNENDGGGVVSEEEPDGVFVLRGIVVENTKTKPARDFYKMYYSQYRLNDINSEYVVTITELLALGSNTKVEVKVGDVLVWQFFVNPRSDYIEQMANSAIKNTQTYLVQQERNKNQIKKY